MMQTLFRKLRFVFEIYYYYISIKKVRPLDALIYIDTTNLVSCCGRVVRRLSSTVLHCISVNSDVPSVYLVLSLTNKFDLFLIENLNNLKINIKKLTQKKNTMTIKHSRICIIIITTRTLYWAIPVNCSKIINF